MKKIGTCLKQLALLTILSICASTVNFAVAADRWQVDPSIVTWSEFNGGNQPFQKFTIKAESQCTFGTLEPMLYDLSYSSRRVLRFSLEPLLKRDEEDFPPRSMDVFGAGGIVSTGKTIGFAIPPTTRPIPVGIFLCKDTDGSGRCIGKRVMPWLEMMKPYGPSGDPKGSTPTDKIYYFQMMIVDKQTIRFPNVVIANARKKTLEADMHAYLDKKQDRDDFFRRYWFYNSIVSRPLKLEGDSIKVGITRYVRENCEG